MTAILRFAPSPNGRLHLGHAYSAWLNARLAKELGGQLLLRIEDIDTTRCTPELMQHCLDDLMWIGLEWDGETRVQSQHFVDYMIALEKLRGLEVVYPCFCTRKQVSEASDATDPDGAPLYPRRCHGMREVAVNARIAAGEAFAWRLDMPKALAQLNGEPLTYTRFDAQTLAEETIAADPARWGDAVLVRKETPTSYHLSVVVDDALQGVTHVVRGQDLEAATDLHVLLQKLLGLPTPLYHHHALLTDGDGKLSKSKGSESLADLRARGVDAEELRGSLLI
jgi:glutamyl-Q tRNA(Asp) synthetase